MVTKLIILGVIVLAVVAVAQLMRVYELSSKLRNKVESEIKFLREHTEKQVKE